jgi:hypothetical protein
MISGRQPLSLLQPDMGSYGVTFLCSTALSLHRESTAHLPDGGLKESYLAPGGTLMNVSMPRLTIRELNVATPFHFSYFTKPHDRLSEQDIWWCSAHH